MRAPLSSFFLPFLAFLVPLVFNPFGVVITELPKMTVLTVGTAVLWLLLSLETLPGKMLPRLNPRATLALLVGVAILGLSFLVSERPTVSFWGDFEKQNGLFTFLVSGLLFLGAGQIFWVADASEQVRRRLLFLQAASLSGLLVALFAILQGLGFDFFPAGSTDLFAGRSFSSLGSPTLLASYLLFPIGAELALLQREPKLWPQSAFFLVVMGAGIYFSGGRGALLALLAVGILFLSRWAIRHFGWGLKTVTGVGLLALLIMSGFAVTFKDNARSLLSRFSMWESSVNMITERPILGYGAANYPLIFERYAEPEFFIYEDYTSLSTHPHNEVLETWVHFGLAGVLFYFGVFFTVLRGFWVERNPLIFWPAASVLGLFVANFFSTSGVTHLTYVALYLALILPLFSAHRAAQRGLRAGALGVALCLLVASFFALRAQGADAHLKVAYDFLYASGDIVLQAPLLETVASAERLAPQYSFPHAFAVQILMRFDRAYHEAALLSNERHLNLCGRCLPALTDRAALLASEGSTEAAELLYEEILTTKAPHPLVYLSLGNFYYDQARFPEALRYYDLFLNMLPTEWTPESERIFNKNHPELLEVLERMEALERE